MRCLESFISFKEQLLDQIGRVIQEALEMLLKERQVQRLVKMSEASIYLDRLRMKLLI